MGDDVCVQTAQRSRGRVREFACFLFFWVRLSTEIEPIAVPCAGMCTNIGTELEVPGTESIFHTRWLRRLRTLPVNERVKRS